MHQNYNYYFHKINRMLSSKNLLAMFAISMLVSLTTAADPNPHVAPFLQPMTRMGLLDWTLFVPCLTLVVPIEYMASGSTDHMEWSFFYWTFCSPSYKMLIGETDYIGERKEMEETMDKEMPAEEAEAAEE